MDVLYEVTTKYGETEAKTEEIGEWVTEHLREGGIELGLGKSLRLVAFLAAKHLEQHPEDVEDVAEIVDCYGRNFRVHKQES